MCPIKDVLEAVWCRRFEMIEILKTKTDNLHDSTKNDSLRVEFWGLVNEMYQHDISLLNCSYVLGTGSRGFPFKDYKIP